MLHSRTILSNPIKDIPKYYMKNTPRQQLYILCAMNTSLLLLHRIVLLLPEDVIRFILGFMFDDKNNIDLYYNTYSIFDCVTQYQYVLHTGIENSFRLNPEEYRLIKNTKNATYITFENYEDVMKMDEEYKEILNDNLYVLPPNNYIKQYMLGFILSFIFTVAVVGGYIFSMVYMIKIDVSFFIILMVNVISAGILIGTILFVIHALEKIHKNTYKIKNMPINV